MNTTEFASVFDFAQTMKKEHLDLLLGSSSVSNAEAGDIILDINKQCSGIGFVLSGDIRFYRHSDEGREITLYHITKGHMCILTASCYLGKGYIDYPVGAVAETASKILFVSFDIFGKLFSESESMRRYFFTAMADRLYNVMDVIDGVAFRSVNSRLGEYILKKTANGKHPLYATHSEIARDIGSAREVVSRLLKKLEKEEIVHLFRGKLEVVSAKSLSEIH